jgi:hypothetical protein
LHALGTTSRIPNEKSDPPPIIQAETVNRGEQTPVFFIDPRPSCFAGGGAAMVRFGGQRLFGDGENHQKTDDRIGSADQRFGFVACRIFADLVIDHCGQ